MFEVIIPRLVDEVEDDINFLLLLGYLMVYVNHEFCHLLVQRRQQRLLTIHLGDEDRSVYPRLLLLHKCSINGLLL